MSFVRHNQAQTLKWNEASGKNYVCISLVRKTKRFTHNLFYRQREKYDEWTTRHQYRKEITNYTCKQNLF